MCKLFKLKNIGEITREIIITKGIILPVTDDFLVMLPNSVQNEVTANKYIKADDISYMTDVNIPDIAKAIVDTINASKTAEDVVAIPG